MTETAQKSGPVVAVLFSAGGGVGKTHLAWELYSELKKTVRPLMVDADLVGGSLTLAADAAGLSSQWNLESITTEALLEHRANIPIDHEFFMPCARWALCAALTDRMKRRKYDAARMWTVAELLEMSAWERAQAETDKALESSMIAQARLNEEPAAQNALWEPLFRFALRSGRHVIVDLPAQGPTGIVVRRSWETIVGLKARVLEDERKRGREEYLSLKRIFVYTSVPRQDEVWVHPLVNMVLREAKTQRDGGDLVAVENMIARSQGFTAVDGTQIPFAGVESVNPTPFHREIRALVEGAPGAAPSWEPIGVHIKALATKVFSFSAQ